MPVFAIFTYVLKTRQGSGLKSNFMNDSHWRNHPLHQKRWKLMKHWKSMLQKKTRCHQAMRWDEQKYLPCLGLELGYVFVDTVAGCGFSQKWIEIKIASLIISVNLDKIWNYPAHIFIKSQLKCSTDSLSDRILLSWTNRHTHSNFMIISVGQYQVLSKLEVTNVFDYY